MVSRSRKKKPPHAEATPPADASTDAPPDAADVPEGSADAAGPTDTVAAPAAPDEEVPVPAQGHDDEDAVGADPSDGAVVGDPTDPTDAATFDDELDPALSSGAVGPLARLAREAATLPDTEDDDLDAPDPARLLARRAVSFRPGSDTNIAPMPSASAAKALALDRHLDEMPERDDDTEDTPPTAVPGSFDFHLYDDDEDDGAEGADEAEAGESEASVSGASVSEEESTVRMDAEEIAARLGQAKALAEARQAAPTPTPAAPAAGGGAPVWLVGAIAIAALAIGLLVGKLL
ncbi:MAG: hypothetical protein H6733_14855 [Alphaproteobacteria bacterium]|nr:hypothetical protein [Alphaproteobacteria bacterium]